MAIYKKLSKSLLFIMITALLLSVFTSVQTASADLCSELAQGTGGFFSCGEGETTFTKFKGGLQPPSEEGYDTSLTQETNLRDFILKTVNFVLGFLGLVAVIVVIYGGVLYVTAAGQEEQTTKGKKSITYALIGIVIILVSFALVNTVIRGIGRGTDQGINTQTQLSGAAPEELTGDQTGAIQRLFFLAATNVERAAKGLAQGYAHYVDVNDLLADLRNVPKVKDEQQITIFINDMKRALNNIVSASGDLSRVSEEAKKAENIVEKWQKRTAEDQILAAENRWWTKDNELNDFQDDIIAATTGLENENQLDFDDMIDGLLNDLGDLKNQLEESGFVSTSGTEFQVTYDRAYRSLENLLLTTPNNQKVVDALEALSELHTVVQNIQFVATVISTDVDKGNGPLIVNMDALKSMRPDFQTINEEDISWDFGDGTEVFGRFAVSHVYKKTGTYIITLKIKGDSSKNIASGVAYKEITVLPPASQLNLKAFLGARDLGYLSLYKDGFLVTDKNRLNVTLSEARDIGITLDASESRGGFQSQQTQEAGETYIQTIRWDFGDNTDPVMGEMVAQDVQTHYYGEQGTYPVIVEVTDSRGIKDRKIFEIVVDSPAARIKVNPGTKTRINQDIQFDAGQSSSDGGQIVGYNWDIQNASLRYSAEKSSESFTESFESPGIYNVNLTITDNLGESATDTTSLIVESEPPEAEYTYSVQDSSKPHIYFFDGTKSLDPDGNVQTGEYTYKWTVAAVDDDYDFVDENGEIDPDGASKKRMYVKFYRIGDYDVTLQVDDPNEPGNPGVPSTKTVKVDSILDVSFAEENSSAAMLDENSEATVTFSGISENGVAYEWDFGDQTNPVSGEMIGGTIQVSHTYTVAGSFDVRLTVFDREDNENTIKRRIIIGEADNPLAVISLKVDGNDIFDLSEPITVNRKSVIQFSAENSLNRDGTGRRLGYQWDFGDTKRSTQKTITHTYSDLSPLDPGYYEATLKVLDKNDLTKTSSISVKIDVVGELPTLQAFTAVPMQNDLTTPVKVKLEAIGALDPDGQIVKYLWWYYNEKDPDLTMGHTITQQPIANITIGTRGVEGEEMTYKFGLKMTDQENFEVDVNDILAENLIPSIDVVNGPNDIPVARFTVDRTSIMVGETINFTSSSFDPDGRIVQYIWDFEGDGFSNNKASSQSTIAHTYETPNVNGINVRLKVIDDNFA